MDYIREEFMRQQEALTVLLLGRRTQSELPETERMGDSVRRRRTSESMAAAAAAVSAVVSEAASVVNRQTVLDGNGETSGGRRAAFLRRGGEREGNQVTADALSRAFQRDARRYDGGFTLY